MKSVSDLITQGSRANEGKIRHGWQYGALSTLKYVLEVGNENVLSFFASRWYSVIERHEIYLRFGSPIWYLKDERSGASECQ
jgi:hypothetical protein